MKQHIPKTMIVLAFVLSMSLLIAACGVSQPVSQPSNDASQNSNTQSQTYQDSYVSYPVSQLAQPAAQGATATPLAQDVVAEAHAIENVFINIYERVNPAVVNIEIVGTSSFNDAITSSGSGFVYDKLGHIITNAHVVRDAREIIVTFFNGIVATAELTGLDNFSDLAVIKVDVDPSRLVPVTIGNSREVAVGQQVVVIGNPFGLKSSLTVGFVSATGRALPSEQLVNLDRNQNGVFNNPSIIQLDASINPGNSGGPVLNLDGEVIGVADAIRTETGIFQGVAFAVPSNTLSRIVPQLIENGVAVYPYLGISSPPSDRGITVAALADQFGFSVSTGVLVSEVRDGSPADSAGLIGGDREEIVRGQRIRIGGDIIVAVDGTFVTDLDDLLAYLVETSAPGDTIMLTVVRGDQTLEIPLVVGERPN